MKAQPPEVAPALLGPSTLRTYEIYGTEKGRVVPLSQILRIVSGVRTLSPGARVFITDTDSQGFGLGGEPGMWEDLYPGVSPAAYGLDPDKPPKTWSELQTAAEKLTDKSKNVYGLAFSAIQTEEGTSQWLAWLQQSGGSLANLTSPDSVAALQIWTDFVAKEQVSKDALIKRQFEMTNSWVAGGAAMVISGPWELQRAKDIKFDWRVAMLPVRDGKAIQASALGGYVWGIPKGAKNKAGAFKVIEFMSMPAQMAQSWLGGRLPPSPNVVIDNPQFPQAYEAFKKQMEFARPRGPHPEWPPISAAVQTAIQEALTGRAKPAQALDKASKVITPLLQKNPLPAGA